MVPESSRRNALRATGAVGLAALSGCTGIQALAGPHHHDKDAALDGPVAPWPTLRGNSRRTGYRPETPSPTRDASFERFADAGAYPEMQPAIGPDGLVFGVDRRDRNDQLEFTENDGFTGFTAIGPDGTERWEVSQRSRHAAPTIVGDTVFLTSAGMTQAIDRRDGSRFWRYEAGNGHLEASPTVVDGTVYICSNELLALDAHTGEQQWSSLDETPALFGTAATSEALYAAAGDSGEGAIYRIDPVDGSRIWTAPDVGECYTHPVVGTDHVYAMGTSGRLHAIDPATGLSEWSHLLDGTAYIPPAVADNTVYVAGENDEYLYALSVRDGAVEWKHRFGLRKPAAPTLVDDILYLPLGEQDSGTLNAYNRLSGEQRNRWTLPHGPSASLALGNTHAVICTGETTKEGRVLVSQ